MIVGHCPSLSAQRTHKKSRTEPASAALSLARAATLAQAGQDPYARVKLGGRFRREDAKRSKEGLYHLNEE
jgi:hypothetical protein